MTWRRSLQAKTAVCAFSIHRYQIFSSTRRSLPHYIDVAVYFTHLSISWFESTEAGRFTRPELGDYTVHDTLTHARGAPTPSLRERMLVFNPFILRDISGFFSGNTSKPDLHNGGEVYRHHLHASSPPSRECEKILCLKRSAAMSFLNSWKIQGLRRIHGRPVWGRADLLTVFVGICKAVRGTNDAR
ncbi:hypothetical protein HYPSUDRAFT_483357 [Hypholoma sublateritium FD-334 SS-4]|uniref:Uncharacterized protein n=1 Tax=Hypholoma sublateritium (strain FD-334 SS-4) TaxID=945553 RepID=A0A0D2P1C3_HYPSF|nr:hypothetical protein HYPSUDRAFT_483357 [Hypholoma sublateritium FD-334 SS-4]